MSDLGLGTLAHYRRDGEVRKARLARRIGVTVMTAGIALGLLGWLGVHTTSVSSEHAGVRVSVQHAAVTRAGLATPFRVEVDRPDGFGSAPLEISISRRLFERLDFNNFYPNPDSESIQGDHVVYQFDAPDGDTFSMTLDARASSNQVGSTDTYDVTVTQGDQQLGSARFRMTVVP